VSVVTVGSVVAAGSAGTSTFGVFVSVCVDESDAGAAVVATSVVDAGVSDGAIDSVDVASVGAAGVASGVDGNAGVLSVGADDVVSVVTVGSVVAAGAAGASTLGVFVSVCVDDSGAGEAVVAASVEDSGSDGAEIVGATDSVDVGSVGVVGGASCEDGDADVTVPDASGVISSARICEILLHMRSAKLMNVCLTICCIKHP
jgi:hypothetical protein